MREIKFRAWDKDEDEMITGFGLTPDDLFPYIIPANDEGYDPANYAYYDNAVLMQFTGQQDVHGQDIYEGDILALVSHSEAIRRNPQYLKVVEWHGAGFNIRTGRSFEVLGNIYENKELLDAKL